MNTISILHMHLVSVRVPNVHAWKINNNKNILQHRDAEDSKVKVIKMKEGKKVRKKKEREKPIACEEMSLLRETRVKIIVFLTEPPWLA